MYCHSLKTTKVILKTVLNLFRIHEMLACFLRHQQHCFSGWEDKEENDNQPWSTQHSNFPPLQKLQLWQRSTLPTANSTARDPPCDQGTSWLVRKKQRIGTLDEAHHQAAQDARTPQRPNRSRKGAWQKIHDCKRPMHRKVQLLEHAVTHKNN